MHISSPEPHNPQQVWIKFQQGDELAFAQIYETYIQVIYNYARKYTKDEALIEDTLHNLFIYLWQNKSNLAVPLSIKFYLFSAVRRSILKELLKRRDVQAQSDFKQESIFRETESSAEENLIENQNEAARKELLHNAIGLLSGNQRKAIELKFYDNLSCQEISGIMGVSPENVYKLISRGLGVLKKNVRSDLYYTISLAFTFIHSELVTSQYFLPAL